MNDSMYAHKATHEIEQTRGMYDYSRQQNIARAKEKEADELRHRLTYICLLVAFVAFLIFIHYQKKKRDRRQL